MQFMSCHAGNFMELYWVGVRGFSIRQWFSTCFRGQPDQNEAQGIDQRDGCARPGVTAFVGLEQVAHLDCPDSSEKAATIVTQTLPGCPDPRGKKFRQIQ